MNLQVAPAEQKNADTVRPRARTRPHIVMVIPRGEAVRNFLYSPCLKELKAHARVTVLSVVHDEDIVSRTREYVDEVLPLKEYAPHRLPAYLRTVVENAHDRWLWSKVAQNNWELRDRRAKEQGKTFQRFLLKALCRALGNNPSLHLLSAAEQYLHWKFRATNEFDELFTRLKPDLVFNGSHIHGYAGELPLRVAQRMGIKTAGFVFSWDNLTSRSRILVPYDYYLVWHEPMKQQLLSIYPRVRPENVFVTGTPQFDFHQSPDFLLSREELCRRIGLDPLRPIILYTSGIWNHFYEEHLHVKSIINTLQGLGISPKPQLVVRNYAKGTAEELKKMATQKYPDVVFPPVLWNERWLMPLYEDLYIYTSLVHHSALSINAASTVTLEFLLKNKPVINLDFDPPGSNLPYCMGYDRHIKFDHFWPIAQSGATMVARSPEDMRRFLIRGLTEPDADSNTRQKLMTSIFGQTLDGRNSARVAETLKKLASQ